MSFVPAAPKFDPKTEIVEKRRPIGANPCGNCKDGWMEIKLESESCQYSMGNCDRCWTECALCHFKTESYHACADSHM